MFVFSLYQMFGASSFFDWNKQHKCLMNPFTLFVSSERLFMDVCEQRLANADTRKLLLMHPSLFARASTSISQLVSFSKHLQYMVAQ